jgi:hypothetical protein
MPAAINVSKGVDGLSYFSFPVQAVPAEQSISVQVDYTMTKAQLSVESLAPPSSFAQEAELPATSNTDKGINWPIVPAVVGGIIIVIVFVWQIATRRAMSNQPIARPLEAKIQSHPKFCRNCSNPIGKGDRFCRKCGEALKDEQTLS